MGAPADSKPVAEIIPFSSGNAAGHQAVEFGPGGPSAQPPGPETLPTGDVTAIATLTRAHLQELHRVALQFAERLRQVEAERLRIEERLDAREDELHELKNEQRLESRRRDAGLAELHEALRALERELGAGAERAERSEQDRALVEQAAAALRERLADVQAERAAETRAARARQAQLEAEAGQLQAQLQAAHDGLLQSHEEFDALRAGFDTLRTERDALDRSNAEVRAEAVALRVAQQSAVAELARAHDVEVATLARTRGLDEQLASARGETAALRSELLVARRETSTATEERRREAARSAQLVGSLQQRDRLVAQLQQRIDGGAAARQSLQTRLDEAVAVADAKARALDEARGAQLRADAERDALRNALAAAERRRADAAASLNVQLLALQSEMHQSRSALVGARRSADRARQTLSFRLGNALVLASKSWQGVRDLPGHLIALRRDARLGRFRGGDAGASDGIAQPAPDLHGELDTLFARGGAAAAERLLRERAATLPGNALADGYTHVARLALATNVDHACRLGAEAVRLDPKPYRLKWLGLLLFDAGRVTAAHEQLLRLPPDLPLKPSERHKIERVAGCLRLQQQGVPIPPRGPRPADLSGPVLYVAASAQPYHVSGYTVRTQGLLRALRDLGHDVLCLTRPGYPDDRSDARQARSRLVETVDGVRYECLPGPHRRKQPPDKFIDEAAAAIEARARELRSPLIHAASNHENALPALIAARRLGLPFVYDVRGLWEYTAASKRPEWEGSEAFALEARLETLVASAADIVFTLNQALADELVRRGLPRDRVRLAPNAIDTARCVPVPRDQALARSLGLDGAAFTVGYVGSVVGYEGLDDLLAAVARLHAEGLDVRVLVAGDGDALPALRDQARALGLEAHAVFTGAVAHSDIARHFALLDAVALPRKPLRVCQLVAPLKPLEAMALCVPLVVSDVAALREMVDDGRTGLVAAAGDIEALADRLRTLARDPALRVRLADAALDEVRTQRTWSACARQVAGAYPPPTLPAAAPQAAHAPSTPVATPAAVADDPSAPVPLPVGTNALDAAQKEALDARLAAALSAGGPAAVECLLQRQGDGRSARFAAFCALRGAQACLAAGHDTAAEALTERALGLDRGTSTVRGAVRVYGQAAMLERAATLADELARSAPALGDADRRLVDEARARAQLQDWAMQPPQPRATPGIERRVLNVLAFSLPYTSVGYATRSHGLALGIRAAGWDIRPVTRPGFPFDFKPELDGQELPEHDDIDGLRYRRLFDAARSGMSEVEYLLACIDHYTRLIEAEQPAVVHAASNYVTALPALIAARRLGVPFVYEVRGFWEVTRSSRDDTFENTPKYRLMQLFEGVVARQADRVITITTAMKEELVGRGVPAERIDIAFNSVDPERFAPRPRDEALAERLGLPSGVPVIGYVGSFVDYEGLDDLVTAAASLRGAGHDFRLLLVGDGAVLGALQEQVERLQLQDRVLLTGRVPHDEVEAYYSLIDIAPFPRKPWPVCELVSPLKPFEAMALGKAVVVSDTRALGEIITDGKTGLVFTKGEVTRLHHTLASLLASDVMRRRLGKCAREWVVVERSWSIAGAAVATGYVRTLEAIGRP